MSHPYAPRKPGAHLQFHEGTLLKRVVGAFVLLLALTFVTLTLYLGNMDTVARILESYVVSFP